MKSSIKKTIMISAMGVLLGSAQSHLLASGAAGAWFAQWFVQNEPAIQSYAIEGVTFASSFVEATIAELTQLYQQNPDAFNQFFSQCLQNTNNPISGELTSILQQYNLIEAQGTINNSIQTIVIYAVEQIEDGSFKIWTVGELVTAGWITAK